MTPLLSWLLILVAALIAFGVVYLSMTLIDWLIDMAARLRRQRPRAPGFDLDRKRLDVIARYRR